MEKVNISRNIFIRHFFNWITLLIIRYNIHPFDTDILYTVIQSAIEITFIIISYYGFCYYVSPLIQLDSKLKVAIRIALFYLITMFLLYFAEYQSIVFFNGFDWVLPSTPWSVVAFIYTTIVAMLAHGFYQKQISIQKLNAQSEKERIGLAQETLFFKNQFNSHISLNFLSYCYSHALQKDPLTSKAIETYSEMMKYTLQTEANEEVSLKKEVAYIEQFILLQKQIGKEIYVNFSKSEDLMSISILPRILINYVENAFKYGISDEADKPISIQLETRVKHLHFSISNYKREIKLLDQSTGTGQYNSKQQLELFYPSKYQLEVFEDESIYTTQLKIKIA